MSASAGPFDDAVVGPEHPDHPDHALYRQIRAGVHRLDAECGREPDAISARMVERLLPLAREHGLRRVDHVVLSRHLGEIAPGERVFVVQGALDDPAHLRAHIGTDEALGLPPRASRARLRAGPL